MRVRVFRMVLLCALLATMLPSSAFAVPEAAPHTSPETYVAEGFENVTSNYTVGPDPLINLGDSSAWWGRVSGAGNGGGYGLWCAGTGGTWPYHPLYDSQGLATFPVSSDYYSLSLSFHYRMPSIGQADTDWFITRWCNDALPGRSVVKRSVNEFPVTSSWLARNYSLTDPSVAVGTSDGGNLSRRSGNLVFLWWDYYSYPGEPILGELGPLPAGSKPAGPTIDNVVMTGWRYGPVRNLSAIGSMSGASLSWSKPWASTQAVDAGLEETRTIGYAVWRAPLGTTSWTLVTTEPTSGLTLEDPGNPGGDWIYAVQVLDAQGHYGELAPYAQVHVPGTFVTLTPASSTLDGGASATFSGVMTNEHGTVLSGKTVALQSSPNGTSWSSTGRTATTSGAGTYSFGSVSPASRTYYRVTFAGDGTTRSATSPTAVVDFKPVAAADSYETAEDTPLSVGAAGVLANDSDVDGDPLTAVKVTNPSHGSVALGTDGSFTYTPAADYNGSDSFTYRAYDGKAYSNTVTVSITVTAVNDAPVATADSYKVLRDRMTVIASPGVLGNDIDVDGDAMTVSKLTDPAHGLLSVGSNGSFTYAPEAGYLGEDSFTYTVSDGTLTDVGTVSITVRDTIDIEDQEAGVTFDRFVTGFSGSYSGGTYIYGRWTNTELQAKFIGNKIRWIGPKQPSYGKADVYIDGVKKATVDCYAAVGSLSEIIFDSGTLATDGAHTIKIRLVGAKNSASSGNVIVVDRFEVGGSAPSGAGSRLNEQGFHATFVGTWIKAANPTYTSSTYAYSAWAGPVYTAAFSGTRVAWIGPKSLPYGKANVYIDGALKGTVDCYSAATGWRYKIWESALLPSGNHTIQVRPTHTKNAAATSYVVVVDALDVTP